MHAWALHADIYLLILNTFYYWKYLVRRRERERTIFFSTVGQSVEPFVVPLIITILLNTDNWGVKRRQRIIGMFILYWTWTREKAYFSREAREKKLWWKWSVDLEMEKTDVLLFIVPAAIQAIYKV